MDQESIFDQKGKWPDWEGALFAGRILHFALVFRAGPSRRWGGSGGFVVVCCREEKRGEDMVFRTFPFSVFVASFYWRRPSTSKATINVRYFFFSFSHDRKLSTFSPFFPLSTPACIILSDLYTTTKLPRSPKSITDLNELKLAETQFLIMPDLASSNLFKPIKLGPVSLDNRLVDAPTTRFRNPVDYAATDSMLEYYRASAKDNGGFLIVEATFQPQSLVFTNVVQRLKPKNRSTHSSQLLILSTNKVPQPNYHLGLRSE